MPTADLLSDWLDMNSGKILELALASGFKFDARKTLDGSVLVKCSIPGKADRYIQLADHRVETHGGKPHICNSWAAKGNEGIPEKWSPVYSHRLLRRQGKAAKETAAIMCLTQTSGYEVLKEDCFPKL